MRPPLLDGHGSCLVWLGDSDPFAAHLCVELHLDGSFAQVVPAKEHKHHAHARQSLLDDHEAVEVELGLGANELDGEEASVVDHLYRVEVDRPQHVAQLFLRTGVSLRVSELEVELVELELLR